MEVACFSCGRIFNNYETNAMQCPECEDKHSDIFKPFAEPIWKDDEQ